MDKTESARLTTTIDWLEKTQRQDLARIAQLEEKFDLLWTKIHEQELKQRVVEDALTAIQSALQRLALVEELARQVSERHERLAQDVLESQQRTEKVGRLQQTDGDRFRQDLTELTQRIDYLGRELELVSSRLSPLNEGLRHQQELWIAHGQKLEELQQQDDTLAMRAHLAGELAKRNEYELALLRQEIEPLRKQDEVVTARLQIVADHARHLESQLSMLPALEQGLKDLSERIQVHRIEQQRIQSHVEALRLDLDGHLVKLDEQSRLIKQLDERRQINADQIVTLRAEIAQHHQEVDGILLDWQRLVEQHRLADITEMERQLREIKQRSSRLLQGSAG